MKVSQAPENITNIITKSVFTVPLFQREYSWNLEQVSDLYYDIQSTDTDSGHFLGSLLLYNDKAKNKMEIVDGQQRMTTLFLLLFSILEQIKDTGNVNAISRLKTLLFIIDPNDLSDNATSSEPRMETGKRDKKLFKSIIKGDDFSVYKDGRMKSHKNLTNTLDFFNSRLTEIKDNDGVNGVISFTEKVIKCQFIVMTAEEQSDKLLLFKTVNARGLDLTQGDLIKNELCANISEVDMEEAIETWDEMRGRIEKNNGNLDTFLFHYINSVDYIQEERRKLDEKRGVTNWDKNNYPPVPEKYLFDIYGSVIKRESPQLFLENLLNSSNDYTEFINPSNSQIYLSSLKSMGVNKCFPLFLNVKRKLSKDSFKSFSKAIDSLTFRHSILRNDPKELERFYYGLAEFLKDDNDVEKAINKIKSHQNFREEEKFRNEFINSNPKGSTSKMILDRIVRKLSESVDWSNKDTHIEHIMPQKPKGEWLVLYNYDKEQYKDNLNRLGNLTILQDKKNIRARNKDFSEKKKYYMESRLKITNHLNEFSKWDYEEIQSRQEKLYELAKDIWA